jgi:hypothetical protein
VFDTLGGMPPLQPHELENLRRSIAMLGPGDPALSRERALELLTWLQRTEQELSDLRNGLEALLRAGQGRR